MGRSPLAWSDLPQRPPGYVAPLIVIGECSPPWTRSGEHPRISEWIGWTIAAYGSTGLGRTFFCATNTPDAPVWDKYVDLDRGEWQAWGGTWQPLNPEPTPSAAAAPTPVSVPAIDEPTAKLCQFGEYPDPTAEWDTLQLEGWRTVRGEDGVICGKFGPDAPEQSQAWGEWISRVRLFSKQRNQPEVAT